MKVPLTSDANLILHELIEITQQGHSPWRNRKGAAAYCCCSTSAIDQAADRGEIKRYKARGTPMFRREDLDKWIMEKPTKEGQV